MKLVEIRPQVEENSCGYKTRRNDPTGKISAMDIEQAIKTSEYRAVKPKNMRFSVQISSEQFKHINEYALKENVSIEIAIQWFWTTGFKLMRQIHKARVSTPNF